MGRQNEFYKKTHPEQFSDSVLVKKGNLSRDMFDYYLESLTSKNLEKTFEEFCRKLAESEVCPNLLPQTGPTGGGDSKVDSETYPVSKEISDRWYFGNTAASERWAFAISAKKDWQSKVKSDVVKIVSVAVIIVADDDAAFPPSVLALPYGSVSGFSLSCHGFNSFPKISSMKPPTMPEAVFCISDVTWV